MRACVHAASACGWMRRMHIFMNKRKVMRNGLAMLVLLFRRPRRNHADAPTRSRAIAFTGRPRTDQPAGAQNSLMGSKPGHPFWLWVRCATFLCGFRPLRTLSSTHASRAALVCEEMVHLFVSLNLLESPPHVLCPSPFFGLTTPCELPCPLT